MSNGVKYIDRNPDVQAAGKLVKPDENIGDSLKIYSIEEAACNILSSSCKKLHKNAQESKNLCYSQFLPKESLKDLLSPELRKSRFVTFKEKFSEDMYFKKAEIGKASALPSKPREFTNENFVYGLKHETSENLYELVFPKKTAKEVEEDFLKWHDKYLISHKHYLPSERIERNYNHHFKPHSVYGISTNTDKTGLKVKKCLQFCDRMVVINKAQKKFQELKIGQLGEKIDRYNYGLPTNQIFGIQSIKQNDFTAKALIENDEPCTKNIEITEALSHINNLRRILFNRCDFHMNDLRTILKIYDENGMGYVKFSIIMKLLRSLQIHANEQKLRAATLHFQMFKDDNENSELVNVEEFWKMLHIQYQLPRKINLTPFNKICANNRTTTYRLLCSDRDKLAIDDQILPRLSGENELITAGELIAPDVSMRYGLSAADFKVLRPKEEINIIFKHLLSHNFDEVWQFACTKKVGQGYCKMSVNEFKHYLDEYNRQL